MDKPGRSYKDLTSLTSNDLSSLLSNLRGNQEKACGITQNLKKQPNKEIQWAFKRMEEIFEYTGETGIIPIKEVENVVMPVIMKTADIPHLYHLFYEHRSKDEIHISIQWQLESLPV